LGDVPIIGLTATATPKVEDILKTWICVMPKLLKLPLIGLIYYEVLHKKLKILNRILFVLSNNTKENQGIIYCLSRKKVEAIAEVTSSKWY
jgi:ATP-dependent DNA helicase RecQ